MPENFQKRIFLSQFYRRDDLIRKIIWEKYLLPKEVEKDQCDVLLSMYQSATNLKTKHIMLVHDAVWKIFPEYINNWRKKIYYRLVDEAIAKADKIMTISENSKKDIVKYFNVSEDKIKVSYIDCDPIFKNQHKQIEKQEKVASYIFYVGGFDVRKNVSGLIEAYGLLWNKYQDDKKKFPDLILAGSFHKNLVPLVTNVPEKIKEIAEKYNLPKEKIKTIDFVEQKYLPDWYKNARLFCYPSLYEGFGLPVLEAMNCGCPIVTSNTSSIPEVCSEKSAVLIDPENPEEISQAMWDLLNNKQPAEEKIANAKDEARKFSWEKFAKKFLEDIKNLEK